MPPTQARIPPLVIDLISESHTQFTALHDRLVGISPPVVQWVCFITTKIIMNILTTEEYLENGLKVVFSGIPRCAAAKEVHDVISERGFLWTMSTKTQNSRLALHNATDSNGWLRVGQLRPVCEKCAMWRVRIVPGLVKTDWRNRPLLQFCKGVHGTIFISCCSKEAVHFTTIAITRNLLINLAVSHMTPRV
ncbi:hypothetical protein J6590_050225 [Homalodisca vitripennis]|nr:hypothetical protein J6590_050225 [Homalodisca vitripennis]